MSDSNAPTDSIRQFERLLRVEPTRFVFVLYVAGASSRSLRAIRNARTIFDELLRDRYELRIVDLYKNPEAARDEQIFAVPTLVRTLPAPLRHAVGDLSSRDRLIAGLGLAA